MRAGLLAGLLLAPLGAAAAQGRTAATEQYDEYFKKYSRRYFGPAWDWRVFKAQALTESRLNPQATSPVGARGLMQLMPSTFAAIQSRDTALKSIDDPEFNIAAGIKHDRSLWRQWREGASAEDRITFMFASYNAGFGTVSRAQEVAASRQFNRCLWTSVEAVAHDVPRWRNEETLGYVRKITDYRARIDSRGRLRATPIAPKPAAAPAAS